MLSRDFRDIVGGVLLMVLGLGFAWYAAGNYELGTLARMGTGRFPTMLGLILAGFGLLIAVPAVFRAGVRPEVAVRAPVLVLLSLAGFAATIQPFGLLPAIVTVIVVSSLADAESSPAGVIVSCVLMCLAAWLIFRVGLRLPIALLRWPF